MKPVNALKPFTRKQNMLEFSLPKPEEAAFVSENKQGKPIKFKNLRNTKRQRIATKTKKIVLSPNDPIITSDIFDNLSPIMSQTLNVPLNTPVSCVVKYNYDKSTNEKTKPIQYTPHVKLHEGITLSS